MIIVSVITKRIKTMIRLVTEVCSQTITIYYLNYSFFNCSTVDVNLYIINERSRRVLALSIRDTNWQLQVPVCTPATHWAYGKWGFVLQRGPVIC